jgi:hypothetical protein
MAMQLDEWRDWWLSGDGGWEQVVKRNREADPQWYAFEVERCGCGTGLTVESKPESYWDLFWREG